MARPAVLSRSMSNGLARARRRHPAVPLDIVCFCQGIERRTLLEAIEAGIDSLERIQEVVGATTGPCGGSCTPSVQAMLDSAATREATPPPASPGPRPGKTEAEDRQPADSIDSDETSSQSDPRARR
jgi:NAD(P)H-nitrite reductase large subunit